MSRIEKTIQNFYRDSVALMQTSARIERLPGVVRAAAIMATPANMDLLKDADSPPAIFLQSQTTC